MKLTDPFDVVHKKDIKKNGVVVAQVDYVGWSQVADRLDEAAPGWSFEVVTLNEDWCLGKLTIGDRVYMNVGYAENADADWKKEALKDAVSDALKRCAALAGVARYLYDKDPRPVSPVSARPSAPPKPVAAPAAKAAPDREPYPWDGLETLPEIAQETFAGMVDESKCPTHDKPWKTNSRGYYCSTKVGDGWCRQQPSKAWAAHQETAA